MKVRSRGAGIGGLVTALVLQRRGILVQVFESAPQVRAAGGSSSTGL